MGLYLVQSFKGANILSKLALIFLLAAFVLGWIAYCTASWGRVEDIPNMPSDHFLGYGVWRVADNAELKASITHADGWLLEWYGGFQACATIAFIALNVGFFLVVLFIFVGPCKSNADLSFWNAIINITGGVFWLIAVILFAAKFDDKFNKTGRVGNNSVSSEEKLHYSFVFAIFTFALQLGGGIVLLLTKRGGGAVSSK